jgi:hypothetical protein
VRLSEWQAQFSDLIKGRAVEGAPATASQAARLAVYQRGHWLRLSRSLREDFVLTERLLGRTRFTGEMRSFLDTERGFQPDIGEVSDVFAAFLRARFPRSAIARAAQLDLQSVYAASAPEPDNSGRGYGLHPSVQLFTDGKRFYASWRSEEIVERKRISEGQYHVLTAFDPAGDLSEIGLRLGEMGLMPDLVQAQVAELSRLGLVVAL